MPIAAERTAFPTADLQVSKLVAMKDVEHIDDVVHEDCIRYLCLSSVVYLPP